MKLLFLFCFATTVLPKIIAIRCYQCNDCSHRDMIAEPCHPRDTGCVSIRLSRTKVVRDCYSKSSMGWCTVATMANNTCTYCDDFDGCNMAKPDALICRSCDWTTSGTCEVQRVCRSPFRTENPQCYVLYRYPYGFHFGCFDDMSKTVELLQGFDKFGITYRYCDSNDCNWHAKEFWPDWEHMLDPHRICKVCFKDSAYCGIKQCSMRGIYSRFCVQSVSKTHTVCMSDIVHIDLKHFITSAKDILCTSDNCNADKDNSYPCFRDYSKNEFVTRPRDGCAMFLSEYQQWIFVGLYWNIN